MNNIKQIDLYKSRSYTSCITEAFNIFAHNLKTIFLHTWLCALVLAVFQSLGISAAMSFISSPSSPVGALLLAVSALLSVCASVFLYGRAVGLVNGQRTSANVKRVARLAVVYLVFWLVVGVVIGMASIVVLSPNEAAKAPQAHSLITVLSDVVCVIIGLLVLPYIYVFTKYLMEQNAKLRQLLLKSYKKGLRHWGFIFTTMFLTYLCMTVCVVILALPAVIIISARITSISGMTVLGDPSGLPAYFDFLQFGLFMFAAFIWSYISIFCLFVCILVYGSIETREKEKKMFIDNLKEPVNQTTETVQ